MKTNSATSVAAGAWRLRLYIAGTTPRAVAALANLERICEERLHGRYMVEVVDLRKTPRLAKDDQILAVPTLVRRLLLPIRKIIGDLSNVEHVLVGLELKPQLPRDIDATET
ncbi:MAG: circadian clock KaiB family protein [Verrucomicrobiota bacterium]|jgi:circadian clock protein KaiB